MTSCPQCGSTNVYQGLGKLECGTIGCGNYTQAQAGSTPPKIPDEEPLSWLTYHTSTQSYIIRCPPGFQVLLRAKSDMKGWLYPSNGTAVPIRLEQEVLYTIVNSQAERAWKWYARGLTEVTVAMESLVGGVVEESTIHVMDGRLLVLSERNA